MPRFPKRLPGSFWGITSFFNPAGYANKAENYRKFRESAKSQGLNLITVELAFEDGSFDLTKDDAEILVQVRSNSVLWQKERLLNIGLKQLPENCDKIAWIDCDMIFKNNKWIKDASELLEEYAVVQLFSFFIPLPQNSKRLNFYDIPFGYEEGKWAQSTIYNFAHLGNLINSPFNSSGKGMPGNAWSARKEVFEKTGFYDKSIIGTGDAIMADALCGKKLSLLPEDYPEKLNEDIKKWSEDIYSVAKGSVFYLDNIAFHLWHGDYKNRNYNFNSIILKKHDFDPNNDLMLNKYGCFEWASEKKEMHKEIMQYFFSRKEANFSDIYKDIELSDPKTSISKKKQNTYMLILF